MKASLVIRIIIAFLVGGFGGWIAGASQAKGNIPVMTSSSGVPLSAKSIDLQITMRKLWEDHITWTRLWIMDFASNNGFADSDAVRLLSNQEDIGNAIKPYYGDNAGNQLTILLKQHINGAVDLVKAAKAGDRAALTKANTDWYNNGNQIADFLAKANPNWSDSDLRAMMKSHLDLTKQEAVDILGKKYDVSVKDYDNIHDEILQMSDSLSSGIIKQFPNK